MEVLDIFKEYKETRQNQNSQRFVQNNNYRTSNDTFNYLNDISVKNNSYSTFQPNDNQVIKTQEIINHKPISFENKVRNTSSETLTFETQEGSYVGVYNQEPTSKSPFKMDFVNNEMFGNSSKQTWSNSNSNSILSQQERINFKNQIRKLLQKEEEEYGLLTPTNESIKEKNMNILQELMKSIQAEPTLIIKRPSPSKRPVDRRASLSSVNDNELKGKNLFSASNDNPEKILENDKKSNSNEKLNLDKKIVQNIQQSIQLDSIIKSNDVNNLKLEQPQNDLKGEKSTSQNVQEGYDIINSSPLTKYQNFLKELNESDSISTNSSETSDISENIIDDLYIKLNQRASMWKKALAQNSDQASHSEEEVNDSIESIEAQQIENEDNYQEEYIRKEFLQEENLQENHLENENSDIKMHSTNIIQQKFYPQNENEKEKNSRTQTHFGSLVEEIISESTSESDNHHIKEKNSISNSSFDKEQKSPESIHLTSNPHLISIQQSIQSSNQLSTHNSNQISPYDSSNNLNHSSLPISSYTQRNTFIKTIHPYSASNSAKELQTLFEAIGECSGNYQQKQQELMDAIQNFSKQKYDLKLSLNNF